MACRRDDGVGATLHDLIRNSVLRIDDVGIVAGTAVEIVDTCATIEGIVAFVAEQEIGFVIADDDVVAFIADALLRGTSNVRFSTLRGG